MFRITSLRPVALAACLTALPLVPVSAPAQSKAQSAAQSAKAAQDARVVELETRVAELEAEVARHKTVAENAQQQVVDMRAALAERDELIALAVSRNAELYAIASEVVDKGISTRSAEPFIQSRRVEMENLKQSYEDRLRTARFYETTLAPSVQKRMDEDLARKKAEQSGAAAE